MTDATNPDHYRSHPSGVECIEITRHMSFDLGNAVKYIWRADLKHQDGGLEDLRKAAWYIADEIKRREAANNPTRPGTPEPSAGPSEGAPRDAQPGLRVGARVRVRDTCDFRTGDEGKIVGRASSGKFDWDVHIDGYMLPGEFHAHELEVIG